MRGIGGVFPRVGCVNGEVPATVAMAPCPSSFTRPARYLWDFYSVAATAFPYLPGTNKEACAEDKKKIA